MAVYGRFGDIVTIRRLAVLADIEKLDGRKPEQRDRDALANGSYVVVDHDGTERLYHLAYLRADGGSLEISEAIRALEGT